jgi:hypothetical protein
MADSIIPLGSTLQAIWHIGAWGLAITLAVLWAWELSASRRHAKAERNLREWSSETSSSNLDHYEDATTDLARSAKMNTDILSRLTRPSSQRRGY